MSLNRIFIMTRARQKTSYKVTFVEKHIPTDGKKDAKNSISAVYFVRLWSGYITGITLES